MCTLPRNVTRSRDRRDPDRDNRRYSAPDQAAAAGSGQSPEVLEERAWDELSPEDATAELDGLKSRLGAEPGARLSISWRLTRPRGKE